MHGALFSEARYPAGAQKNITVNPFTLRAAKRGLTIMEIFYLQKHFLETI